MHAPNRQSLETLEFRPAGPTIVIGDPYALRTIGRRFKRRTAGER